MMCNKKRISFKRLIIDYCKRCAHLYSILCRSGHVSCVRKHPMRHRIVQMLNAQDAIFNICPVIVTLTIKKNEKKLEKKRICL